MPPGTSSLEPEAPLIWDDVRRIALEFPGVEEGTSYHTPAFRVRGKLIGRLHDNGDDLILRVDRDTRAILARVRPDVFHFGRLRRVRLDDGPPGDGG